MQKEVYAKRWDRAGSVSHRRSPRFVRRSPNSSSLLLAAGDQEESKDACEMPTIAAEEHLTSSEANTCFEVYPPLIDRRGSNRRSPLFSSYVHPQRPVSRDLRLWRSSRS